MIETTGLIGLWGKTPEEVVTELNKEGPVRCRVIFTGDPRGGYGGDQTEKRVIRIKEKDGVFELLVASFLLPAFDI